MARLQSVGIRCSVPVVLPVGGKWGSLRPIDVRRSFISRRRDASEPRAVTVSAFGLFLAFNLRFSLQNGCAYNVQKLASSVSLEITWPSHSPYVSLAFAL